MIHPVSTASSIDHRSSFPLIRSIPPESSIVQFSQRSPSTGWEPTPLKGDVLHVFWTWYKPPSAPQGLVIQIPAETFRDTGRRWPITFRALMESLQIEPRGVECWSFQGMVYEGLEGSNPAWNYVINEPKPDTDPLIAVFLYPTDQIPSADAHRYSDEELNQIFNRMQSEWTSSLLAETQLGEAARQLNAALSRCNTLNRDLNGMELNASDQVDRQEWLEARRKLRDTAHRLARYAKDHHIGITSDAGQRPTFEAIYEQYVLPRIYFDGLEKADRDFEARRKSLQHLLNNMKAAQVLSASEAENRAKQILVRIAAKVRKRSR